MEILYPDVVGSGGAPKRIMKPKRKGADMMLGSDDGDMPGTGVIDLQHDKGYIPPPQPTVPSNTRQSLSQAPTANMQPVPVPHPRPTAAAIPPRTTITSTSALTPPEETTHTRKRFMQASSVVSSGTLPSEPKTVPQTAVPPPEKRRRISHHTSAASSSHSASDTISSTALVMAGKQLLEEGLGAIAEALKARVSTRWSEQAMDIFWREFSEEDMDLQLKIAEKVLGDENKAMAFCKMPATLRKHYVKRLREVHNRSA
jgi:hypothetical protein